MEAEDYKSFIPGSNPDGAFCSKRSTECYKTRRFFMKLSKSLPILLVSMMLVACGNQVSIEMGGDEEMAAAASPMITAESSAEEKITSALSAAPDIVSSGATVLDWPAADGEDPGMLREGDNGWTCFPDRFFTPGLDPMCFDSPAMEWVGYWMVGEDPQMSAMGLSYMLMGSYDNSNTDPFAGPPENPEDGIVTGPHIMVFPVDATTLAGLNTDHTTNEPYVMFQDTPFAHLMMPTANFDVPGS